MANLQVKNVPDSLHRKLRRMAARDGRTIRDIVLEAVRSKLERDELYARVRRREPVELGRSAAASLSDARSERERELGL